MVTEQNGKVQYGNWTAWSLDNMVTEKHGYWTD